MPLICRLEPSYFLPFLGRFLEKALSLAAIHSVNHSPSTKDFAENGKDYIHALTLCRKCMGNLLLELMPMFLGTFWKRSLLSVGKPWCRNVGTKIIQKVLSRILC